MITLDNILHVLSALGGTAFLVSIAGWLASKLIENRLNRNLSRDIESYKAKLKSESDSEIEKLKSSLQIIAKEREIARTWLHQKQANTIEALYVALIDLRHSVHIVLDILSPRNPTDIRKYTAEAYKKTREVYESYAKAKIFLAPKTCERIELVITGLQHPLALYYAYLGNYDDHELNSLSDVKNLSWQEIQDNVPPALDELEKELRKILGVDQPR